MFKPGDLVIIVGSRLTNSEAKKHIGKITRLVSVSPNYSETKWRTDPVFYEKSTGFKIVWIEDDLRLIPPLQDDTTTERELEAA